MSSFPFNTVLVTFGKFLFGPKLDRPNFFESELVLLVEFLLRTKPARPKSRQEKSNTTASLFRPDIIDFGQHIPPDTKTKIPVANASLNSRCFDRLLSIRRGRSPLAEETVVFGFYRE